jgi:hypothetical protein
MGQHLFWHGPTNVTANPVAQPASASTWPVQPYGYLSFGLICLFSWAVSVAGSDEGSHHGEPSQTNTVVTPES